MALRKQSIPICHINFITWLFWLRVFNRKMFKFFNSLGCYIFVFKNLHFFVFLVYTGPMSKASEEVA